MKAYTAKEIAYRVSKMQKGIDELNKIIHKKAELGKFTTGKITKCYDWGSSLKLKEYFEKEGYSVDIWDVQCSPNDSNYYIQINWGD